MSRPDAGAAGQEPRHVRDRLESSLGGGAVPLLADGRDALFEYDGGPHRADEEPGSGAAHHPGSVAGKAGPALRWRMGFRVALLISVLAVLGGAWFWFQVAAGQPQVVPLSRTSPEGSRPAGETAPAGRAPGKVDAPGSGPPGPQPGVVIIHVAGAVAAPGVVQLPAGSRVHEAIAAAGGGTPAADLNRLNLAAELSDGQKLHVPEAGEQLPAGQFPGQRPGGGAESGSQGTQGKVNLNTAGVQELDTLPKVGPVLAQRIVDWRKDHGPFRSVEELDAIDGVGPKMLEALLPLVGL